jgi:BON domain-containing protein
MIIRPKLRMPLLAAALAASVASAWATYELKNATYVPALTTEAPPAGANTEPATAVSHELALDPNETIVTVDEAAPKPRTEPRITITEPRLTADERIQAEVMELLASNPGLSGKIGVESFDSVVRLSGWTMTSGQKLRAERQALGVRGVRYVVNEIRPKVGAITS